jgi:ATP-dependent DNA ligase
MAALHGSSLGGIDLPVPMPLEPMESEPVRALPSGPGWLYEPKWDGYRCILFKAGKTVFIQSRNGKPLGRYFPELEARIAKLPLAKLVLDGELVVPVNGELSSTRFSSGCTRRPAASPRSPGKARPASSPSTCW